MWQASVTVISFPLILGIAGCSLDPSDERPGLGLSGEIVEETVSDWSFSRAFDEIFVETRTSYGVRHSVTIWCASTGDELYILAYDPDEKRWVANVRSEPNVRLKIGGKIYSARLRETSDPAVIAAVDRAILEKYDYEIDEDPDRIAYWRVAAAAVD